MNKQNSSSTRVTQKMRSEAVAFRDGMIVTDDDLNAAMRYPVQLMQMVNRAVHGCGVICGFMFKPDPDLCDCTEPANPGGNATDDKAQVYPGFRFRLMPGTALDCFGMPIELCRPVMVDVSPPLCGCNQPAGEVIIAIRRISAPDAPRGDCCGDDDGAAKPCSRIRDLVEIGVFPADDAPDHMCMVEAPADSNGVASADCTPETGVCAEFRDCGDGDCCGEGWVLLGQLQLAQAGILAVGFTELSKTFAGRKYIRLVESLCADELRRDVNGAGQRATAERLENADASPRLAALLALQNLRMSEVPTFLRQNEPAIMHILNLKVPLQLTQLSDKLRQTSPTSAPSSP